MSGAEISRPEAELAIPLGCKPDIASGMLQTYGVLLVLSALDLSILQISRNALEYLNPPSQNLLGQSLSSLFDQASVDLIRHMSPKQQLRPLRIVAKTSEPSVWDGCLYRSEDLIFLELEPAFDSTETSLFTSHSQLRSAISQLQQVASLELFLQLAVAEIRLLTGFDRVMVYRFDSEGAGEVIAEAKREDLLPYLGLHYPATDIPEQPRQLYQQGLLRYIPDLNAPNAELIPAVHPVTHQPPDLSFVMLRGTDPCCVEYHQNMGVAALMVIALIKDQQLWGLIACHHHTAKVVPCPTRAVCELLVQFIAAELANKVNYEELDYIVKLKSLQSELIESIAQADDLKTALVHPAPRILDVVNAQGVAVCLEDEITLVGATPTVNQIQDLIRWADREISESIFHTHSLPKYYADAEVYKDTATGLLLLRISQVRRYYILWFRPEVLQTIQWAGDPKASITVSADDQVVLSPRRSFASWQETVRLTASPWKASELENALDLRNAIVGIVLNKADELAQINRALARSNQELESFAYAASHDLKEPLRGIHNYATFLIEDYQELLDAAGIDRLRTLVKLTQRMESLIDVLLKFSQLGQTELNRQPTDLNQLLNQVINIFWISHPESALETCIPRPLPTVRVDPVLVNEVFSNLLSNAAKYNDKAKPRVEFGYLDIDEPIDEGLPFSHRRPATPVFYVRDNGIGIRERHLETIFRLFKRLHPQNLYGGGTGAGLTIAKKIIERHNGQIWVTSTYQLGTTLYFTLE